MNKLSRDELEGALKSLGINRGDIVHVQSDLRRIGPVDAELSRNGMLQFYLDAFRAVIGTEGTITTFTATLSCGRTGSPFVVEETPSEMGVFSEFLRNQPGSIRSIHPLVSITGLGPKAESICGGAHFEGYSWDSPWARLVEADAKLVTLGLDSTLGGTSFFHFIETTYGVPYKYTKVLDSPVIQNGKQINGVFTLSVRYLDFNVKNTPVRLKTRMLENGTARQCRVGNSSTWACSFRDALQVGYDSLRNDRYFLLESPPRFRPSEIPWDGPSGEMQLRVDRGGHPA